MERLKPEVEFLEEELFFVAGLDFGIFGEFFHFGEEEGGLAVQAGFSVGLPFFGFVFGEGGGEVFGFVVEEEFGEAFVGEVGVEVGELFGGVGVADGGEADTVGFGSEAVVEGGFGVVRGLVVFVGEVFGLEAF